MTDLADGTRRGTAPPGRPHLHRRPSRAAYEDVAT